MSKFSILLLFVLAYSEALLSSNDLDRMRELGQNAKSGPNLLGRSRFVTQQHLGPLRKVYKTYWKFKFLILNKEQKQSGGRVLADYLLPDDVLPEAYSLRLVPYFQDAPTPAQQFTVDGHVSVTVNARRTTSRIVMHALFLQIHSVNVTQVNISVLF
jgi:hypothetical protein